MNEWANNKNTNQQPKLNTETQYITILLLYTEYSFTYTFMN